MNLCRMMVLATSLTLSGTFAANHDLWSDEATMTESPITAADREHWSFRPLVRPLLPSVTMPHWCRNGIDTFVLAAMEQHELRPAPTASRDALLRRVYLDLIGLPPTLEQAADFARQCGPTCEHLDIAYLDLVEQLLQSPQYGIHWAQHWLDLARFAETDGYEHDKIRPRAWQYRDWVIRALNADMPYSQFVAWQIAGDIIAPDNPDAVTATAFCLSGPDMPDINSQDERKHVLLDELTGTVGSAILGLQIGCAQCHDHVYDPISQGDFYRLRAFFEPAIPVTRDQPVTVLHVSSGTTNGQSHVHLRGDWRTRGPAVSPDVPRIAKGAEDHNAPVPDGQARAELAYWLVSPTNQLSSRVIVNRLWQEHFGRGLCRTPSDFGVMGAEPTHPELLDWLASELQRRDWSLKAMHRLIVTSATYRQAGHVESTAPQQNDWLKSLTLDPANQWLSRFPRRRLRAETVRDAMLAVSRSLVEELDGPGVCPPLHEELLTTLLPGQWNVSSRLADHRRPSVYLFARRNLNYPFFAALDRPAANASCPSRQTSITATQSLSLLNSQFSLAAAQQLAQFVADQADGDDVVAQCRLAAQLTWNRMPTDDEMALFTKFVAQHASASGAVATGPREQLVDICLALLNSSEFLYLE